MFYIIVDRGAGRVWLEEADPKKSFSAKRPKGWTWQDLTGPHGQVWNAGDRIDQPPYQPGFKNRSEAERVASEIRKQFK